MRMRKRDWRKYWNNFHLFVKGKKYTRIQDRWAAGIFAFGQVSNISIISWLVTFCIVVFAQCVVNPLSMPTEI